jgi:hypothetical protein
MNPRPGPQGEDWIDRGPLEEARRLLALLALDLTVVPPPAPEAKPAPEKAPPEAKEGPRPPGRHTAAPVAPRVHDLLNDFGSEGF